VNEDDLEEREADLARRAAVLKQTISQLRRSVEHAERVLLELDGQPRTFFLQQSCWTGD
jgi:hypothetical protein